MTILAFDAAKRRTGYAFSTTDGWITGVVDVADTKALGAIIEAAKATGVTRAVIENCYMGSNVRTLKALQEAQTRIKVACEMAGLGVELVYAQTWQSAYGISGQRKDRKLGAKRVASMLGAGNVSEDEADAVCLADYAERVGLQEELALSGKRGKARRA